jgi:hypothetical protein
MSRKLLCGAVCVVATVASCGGGAQPVDDTALVAEVPASVNKDLDVLFVLGNEASTIEAQQRVMLQAPKLMSDLVAAAGGMPNLHIGVITPDLGTTASASAPAPDIGTGIGSCHGTGTAGALTTGAAYTGPFISDVAQPGGGRLTNYTGNLYDALNIAAGVGAAGCGFQQTLRAVQVALDGNPANAGFLRPSANLAVVIVADQDDCSVRDAGLMTVDGSGPLGPLTEWRCTAQGVVCDGPDDISVAGAKANCRVNAASTYVEDTAPIVSYLQQLKGDPRRVAVRVIAGPPTPFVVLRLTVNNIPDVPALAHGCAFNDPSGSMPVTIPSVRLAAFAAALGGPSGFASLCDDPVVTVGAAGRAIARLVGSSCLDESVTLLDTSSDPGVQPSCEVADVTDGNATPAPLRACDAGGAGDCYALIADVARCPGTTGNLRLEVSRAAPAGPHVRTEVRCRVR